LRFYSLSVAQMTNTEHSGIFVSRLTHLSILTKVAARGRQDSQVVSRSVGHKAGHSCEGPTRPVYPDRSVARGTTSSRLKYCTSIVKSCFTLCQNINRNLHFVAHKLIYFCDMLMNYENFSQQGGSQCASQGGSFSAKLLDVARPGPQTTMATAMKT